MTIKCTQCNDTGLVSVADKGVETKVKCFKCFGVKQEDEAKKWGLLDGMKDGKHYSNARDIEQELGSEIVREFSNEVDRKMLEYTENPHSHPPTEDIAHQHHYTYGKIEPIEFIESMGLGVAYKIGNIIKYLYRYEKKDGIKDLRKAHWYLDRLIKELEEKQT